MNTLPATRPTSQAGNACADAACAAAAAADAAKPGKAIAAKADERLCHLFRDTLKDGRIHPLYLPLLKYRHTRAAG
jgi:hypothetical protein